MTSSAQQFFDREQVRAALRLQWSNGLALRVGAMLARDVRDVVAASVVGLGGDIPRGETGASSAKMRRLERKLERDLAAVSDDAFDFMEDELSELAEDEIDEYRSSMASVLGVAWAMPSAKDSVKEAGQRPMMGHKLKSWWKRGIETSIVTDILGAVRRGVIEGRTGKQIMTEVGGAAGRTGLLAKLRRAAGNIVHTIVGHVVSAVRTLSAKLNKGKKVKAAPAKDIKPVDAEKPPAKPASPPPPISPATSGSKEPEVMDDLFPGGVMFDEWCAVMDMRTSVLCAGLDGKTWPSDEPHIMPPAHMRCRSVIMPFLGKATRPKSYKDWLKKLPNKDQDTVLGPTRAKAWRAGELTLDDMVDVSKSRVLTIDQLRNSGKLK